MNLVAVVASGLFTFFNRVIFTGMLGKAIFWAITTWVLAKVTVAMVADVTASATGSGLGAAAMALGAVGQFFLWVLSWAVMPGAAGVLAGRALRFAIRRTPVVG